MVMTVLIIHMYSFTNNEHWQYIIYSFEFQIFENRRYSYI